MSIDFQKRLQDKLQQYIPVTESGCHIWMGGVCKDGYGKIYSDGKHLKTHRVAYAIYKGIIPEGLSVLHRCDIPSCINPEHLYVGTHQNNMDDRTVRGKYAKGSAHHENKLTEQQVLEIKKSYLSPFYLAKKYNVSYSAIYDIRAGRTWSHLDGK